MKNLVPVYRVTVITESEMEPIIVDRFVKLGAKGYTCVGCRGRGEHEVFEDPLRAAGRVRIEAIVQPSVAEQIMDYLHGPQFAARPLAVCLENVLVSPHDRF
ncbi:MAG: hypothetical protein JSS02_17790 [Planctomycetes bacterium]|nr:hypothetical protein [Planctomycetota bacterium]